MPTDSEILRRDIQRGHLCPECRQTFLALADVGTRCPNCGTTWQSFRELFEAVRTEMAWPEDSWDSWLAGNPDYKEGL